jgi:hypothetical protein
MPFQVLDLNGNRKETPGTITAGAFPALTGNVTTPGGSLVTTVVGARGLFDISGASAGQIKFPATQNASADVNTLDDYEEGTWTPVIGGSTGTSGQTYSVQVGYYTKIGKFVSASFYLVLSAKGTITGNAQIQGLPFTSDATAGHLAGGLIAYWTVLTTNTSFVGIELDNNNNFGYLRQITAAATGVSLMPVTEINNTTGFIGTFVYQATA